MDKKRKSILIWILTWAGLLLAVLYSPIGSPDLYAPIHYLSVNQGAMYNNNTEVENTPTTIKTNVDNSGSGNGFAVQTYSPDIARSGSLNAVVGNTFEATKTNSIALSGNANSLSARGKLSGNGIGGPVIGIGSMKSQSATNNTTTQNTGFIAMSTDMTLLEDYSTTRQSVTTGDGGTDPGGDPTGPPIPVGDGWIFLLVLVSVYSVWKKIKI